MAKILYVDDDPAIAFLMEDTIRRAGHEPVGATDVPGALAVLARDGIDLVISDYRMPDLSGLDLLELMVQEGYDTPLIMVTGHASVEHAVAAIKAGAIDYITKPVRPEQIEIAIEQALELGRLRRENDLLRREVLEVRSEQQIVGESPAIRRALNAAATAAPTRATVLLEGESGTGKELFARAIHDLSDRRDRPFIKLNCAALPEGLVESALFGHEKGAFTGAIKRVAGAFERADGGTLLLDEISEMRLDLQAKLLRVVQEREFERVGGTAPLKVDVRVIATTNRDLAAEAQAGRFRKDLFFRLAVIPVRIPPLRERLDDIPLLAYRFAVRAGMDMGKEITAIAPDAIALLKSYDWPGNVRELQHAVERAVILSADRVLRASSFEGERFLTARDEAATPASASPTNPATNAITTAEGEKDANPRGPEIVLRTLNIGKAESVLIEHALAATGNNRTRAAALLGISVRTLRNKLNGHRPPRPRPSDVPPSASGGSSR